MILEKAKAKAAAIVAEAESKAEKLVKEAKEERDRVTAQWKEDAGIATIEALRTQVEELSTKMADREQPTPSHDTEEMERCDSDSSDLD